jgi:biopolymer transport protein ExbD
MAGGGGELNLVPYLDIVVTLTTAFLALSVESLTLGAATPQIAGSGVGEAREAPPLVEIHAGGVVIAQGDAQVRLGREGETWPYERLAVVLRGLRAAGEASGTLVVAPTPDMPYAVVVQTMDAARQDAEGEIYPDVSLRLAGG